MAMTGRGTMRADRRDVEDRESYTFSSLGPFTNAAWEGLSIFLNFLIPKLPAPVEADLSAGLLESIDMDSYRVEARATMAIALADEDREIEPVPTSAGGTMPEPELDHLSNIIRAFNEQFGNINGRTAIRSGRSSPKRFRQRSPPIRPIRTR